MKEYALITGASRGIGCQIAKKLSSNYSVIGTSTSGKGNIKEVEKWLKADFSSDDGINNFLDLLESLPPIKILVNNAGINIIKPGNEITSYDYDIIQNINLKAPFKISLKISEVMVNNGGGKIINIGSIWNVKSKKNRSLYSTMKTGLIGMTRSMAIEYASKNILINSVSPGFVETELTNKSLNNDQKKSLKEQIPLKRFAKPEEVSELVYFLCSHKNTYLTGQNIVIDGGFTIV